jgi:GNAT superfamily N-acetyltransferase
MTGGTDPRVAAAGESTFDLTPLDQVVGGLAVSCHRGVVEVGRPRAAATPGHAQGGFCGAELLCHRDAMEPVVEFRRLRRTELSRVVEIDRRERIDVLYDQHGTQLVARRGNWSAPAWDPKGHGEHSVEGQVYALEHYVDSGGIALGAIAGGRLVAIGVVVPHLRPGIAQLAFLHVSTPWRATGIGSRLFEEFERIARTAGDSDMVVSATPSENTVHFYLGRAGPTLRLTVAGSHSRGEGW